MLVLTKLYDCFKTARARHPKKGNSDTVWCTYNVKFYKNNRIMSDYCSNRLVCYVSTKFTAFQKIKNKIKPII